jgi:hypothetical protein
VHKQAGPDVFEIGVEDPCEAYARLRLFVDARACMAKGLLFGGADFRLAAFALRAGKTGRIPADLSDAVCRQLKIVPKQAQACFELAWRTALRNDPAATDEDRTAFRVAVKRRLFHDHREELDPGAEDFKPLLEDLFQQDAKLKDATMMKLL